MLENITKATAAEYKDDGRDAWRLCQSEITCRKSQLEIVSRRNCYTHRIILQWRHLAASKSDQIKQIKAAL